MSLVNALKRSMNHAVSYSIVSLVAEVFKNKILNKSEKIISDTFIKGLISQLAGFTVYFILDALLGISGLNDSSSLVKASVIPVLEPAVMLLVSHAVNAVLNGKKITYSKNYLINLGLALGGAVVYNLLVNSEVLSRRLGARTGFLTVQGSILGDMVNKFGAMMVGDLLGSDNDASLFDFDLEAGSTDNMVATVMGIFVEGLLRPLIPLGHPPHPGSLILNEVGQNCK